MKAIQLIVRDAARSLLGTVSPAWAGAIIGGLAADPETIEELDTALQRFQIDAPLDAWRKSFVERTTEQVQSDFAPESDQWGGVLDLPSRMIFWGGGPGPSAELASAPLMDRGKPTETELIYRLPRSWHVVNRRRGWFERVEAARAADLESPPLEVREVLYTRLVDWLAEALCESRRKSEEDPVPAIHAAWLTQPREDLGGRTPRDLLIANLHDIEQEINNRANEWTKYGRPPIPLPRESRAYQFGGIGIHEFTVYYNMIRRLLEKAWRERPGDLLDVEKLAEWLHDEQQEYLNQPDQADSPWSLVPQEVIDTERQWMPLTADPKSTIIDCDCPLCQMMAEENFGPTFVHFDTCNFDPEFVFSPYSSYDEWKSDYDLLFDDQGERSESEFTPIPASGITPIIASQDSQIVIRTLPPQGPPTVGEMKELFENVRVAAMTLPAGATNAPPTDRLWTNSFIAPTPANATRQLRLQSQMFEVAAHSAELRDRLKDAPADYEVMVGVLEEFANLRAAMRENDLQRVGRLTDRCTDRLNRLGVARKDVAEQCADLERSFRRLEATIGERSDLPPKSNQRDPRRKKLRPKKP